MFNRINFAASAALVEVRALLSVVLVIIITHLFTFAELLRS